MNLQTLLKKINGLEAELQLALAKDASIVGNFFAQGGNAFAAPAVLGTTDPNALQVITNNTTRGSVSSAGVWTLNGTGITLAPVSGGITISSTGGTGIALTTTDATGIAFTTNNVVRGSVASTGAWSLTGVSVGLTPTGAVTITAGAASTWSTSAGGLTITSAAAATWSTTAGLLTISGGGGYAITGAANSSLLTSAGSLTVDAFTALNLGNTAATSLVIGNTANLASIALNVQAGQVTTAVSAYPGGTATPATWGGLVVTINGVARKIALLAT